jgi:endonuclease III
MAGIKKVNSKAGGSKARIRRIIERLENAHPDAKLDLDFTNPLELLVALR